MARRGRKPISEVKKSEVLRLHAETASTRETARLTGVSRSSVQNIIHGRHGQTRARAGGLQRRRVCAATVATVRRVYAEAGSVRATAKLLELGRESVRKAVNGALDGRALEAQPPLNAGEVYVVPQNCRRGHWVEVLPCRICLANVERLRGVLDRLREVREQTAAWEAGGREPSHKRVVRSQGTEDRGQGADSGALNLELDGEQQRALGEVRRARDAQEAQDAQDGQPPTP